MSMYDWRVRGINYHNFRFKSAKLTHQYSYNTYDGYFTIWSLSVWSLSGGTTSPIKFRLDLPVKTIGVYNEEVL